MSVHLATHPQASEVAPFATYKVNSLKDDKITSLSNDNDNLTSSEGRYVRYISYKFDIMMTQ